MHKLDAGAGVDLPLGDGFEHLFRHRDRPPVAVVDRVANEIPPLVQKAEVDPPGVDADRVEPTLVHRFGEGGADLVPEPQDVPVEGAVYRHRVV